MKSGDTKRKELEKQEIQTLLTLECIKCLRILFMPEILTGTEL